VVITATAPPPPPPSPVLGLAPASLTFPARTVGTTSPAQTVTLTNNGPGTLTLASITISGDFAFASSCPATLAQGATCTVAVTFTPVTAGARAGSLAIGSNAGASPQSVPLGGTGQSNAVGVLDVAPGSVTFDPQAIGSTSAPLLLTLTNSGTATLNRGPESVDGDYTLVMGAQADAATSSNTCGASIAPAASCALALVFTPTALGTRTGAIALPNDTATPVITVHLAGTGVNAPVPRVLGVRPAILAFGDQAVGAQSPARTVSLTNTSPATATITDLSSDSSEFIVSDTCTAIAPGVSCTALVTFRPNAIGTRLGELTVRTFTENDPYTVQLEGNGIFSATPQLEVSLTRIGFGNSLLGAWTYAGVTLTNVGLVPVVLGSISVLDDFIAAPECPATLDVGGACTLRVAFVPRRLGPHAASVAIFSNASNSPHHIDLTGTGCMIATSPHARVRPLLCGQ